MQLNPASWGRPLQIVAALGAGLLLYLVVSGGIGIAWARHLANSALRGIASTISDIDAVQQKADQNEQAVQALARQTQELQAKADREHKLRVQEQAQSAQLRQQLADAKKVADDLRRTDETRAPVTTLEGARDAINRAVSSRRKP